MEDREKYEVTAHKMLERAKVEYHCTIEYTGNGKILYIDLPVIKNTSITNTSKFLIFLTFDFFFLFKRRAGLRKCGTGPFVNLPMAWTELAQLAQCKGKIQEGNYDFQENQMNILHKSQCINDVY